MIKEIPDTYTCYRKSGLLFPAMVPERYKELQENCPIDRIAGLKQRISGSGTGWKKAVQALFLYKDNYGVFPLTGENSGSVAPNSGIARNTDEHKDGNIKYPGLFLK